MKELICNLHIHSTYSDGTGKYEDIAYAAIRKGVDVVIITDHNVLVKGVDRYFERDGKKTLLLTSGGRIHVDGPGMSAHYANLLYRSTTGDPGHTLPSLPAPLSQECDSFAGGGPGRALPPM